ncbi:MAG: ATP-binding protein [Nocardioidaceae bacterium]
MDDLELGTRVCLPLTAGTALRAVRDRVRRLLIDAAPAGGVDDAVLVVDELVTNAYRHAPPPRVLRLHHDRDGSCLWVEVEDHAQDGVPYLCQPSPATPDGRGMLLVDRLCARWGVVRYGSHKSVWAEVALL